MIVREQILQWVKENNAKCIAELQSTSEQDITTVQDQCNGENGTSYLTLQFHFPNQPDLLVTLEGDYDSFDGTCWNEAYVSEAVTHTETRYRKVASK